LKQQLRWWTTVTEVFRIKDARSLADKKLAKKIAEVLEETLVDQGSHSLSFYVRESSVTVFGNVKNAQEKAFVLELVGRIPGIEACNSHLRIVESEEIF